VEKSPDNTKREWASVKLHREFARWLKIEAVKKDVYMGDLLEQLVKQAVGSAPWRRGDGRSR
jgi:hypothetical protein